MSLLYVSDLHLKDPSDEQYLRFLRFLREVPQAGDTLVLGGDIFDLLIGSKDFFKKKYCDFFSAIQELGTRGCKIYYLEGNHDFHIRHLLCSRGASIVVYRDAFSLEFAKKRIWVDHGDLIDPEDSGYRLLRWFTRSFIGRGLIGLFPGKLIAAIGNWSSGQSRKYHDIKEMDPRATRTKKLFYEYALQKSKQDFELVLLGHSHLKEDVSLSSDGKKSLQYVNLGFSSKKILYGLLSEEDQSKMLLKEYL